MTAAQKIIDDLKNVYYIQWAVVSKNPVKLKQLTDGLEYVLGIIKEDYKQYEISLEINYIVLEEEACHKIYLTLKNYNNKILGDTGQVLIINTVIVYMTRVLGILTNTVAKRKQADDRHSQGQELSN